MSICVDSRRPTCSFRLKTLCDNNDDQIIYVALPIYPGLRLV